MLFTCVVYFTYVLLNHPDKLKKCFEKRKIVVSKCFVIFLDTLKPGICYRFFGQKIKFENLNNQVTSVQIILWSSRPCFFLHMLHPTTSMV
jgi:uncharacterized membrane protein